jgi:endonuclease/exonuclease/phosphatase (EEP) superfamily protein YafD
MHGVFLDALSEHYRVLRHRVGLDALLIQENEVHDSGHCHATALCRNLGGFTCIRVHEFPRLALLLREEHEVVERYLVPLPRLAKLSWFERTYIRGGKTRQKYALVVRVSRPGHTLTLVNFHLDTAGDNQHRGAQVRAIAAALAERGVTSNVVAGGDANAFTWSRSAGLAPLREMMQPLTASLDARLLVDGTPTHYFARQREGLWTHRALVCLGRLGLDHPLPYDVLCSDLPARQTGLLSIPESDHDLVYAVF